MKVLLLGGAGQVGTEIRRIAILQKINIAAPSRSALHLEDVSAVEKILTTEPWDVVINAAAYTDVDRAESEEPAAFAINATVPSQLASLTGKRGIPLLHISTDYVFDGRKGVPYVEADEVGPLNVYGRSKLAGERGVATGNPRHVILRTSWVYSPWRKNFVKTILRLAGEREQIRVVADQRACPTAARDLAESCLQIAARCALGPERVSFGTYHYAGLGHASWYEFAHTILTTARTSLDRIPEVVAISTREYPTPARRPLDTRLNCEAIVRAFDVRLHEWQTSLANTLDQLLAPKDAS